MPANPKYLTQSPWQKVAKLSAGIIGGYTITALLHMFIAIQIPLHNEIIVTSTFSLFLIWCILLIIPYLFNNGWTVWIMYGAAIVILYLLYFFANKKNPFL